VLTFEQIKELLELVAQRQLQGLELERSGFRLRIDGRAMAPAAAVPAAAHPPMAPVLTDFSAASAAPATAPAMSFSPAAAPPASAVPGPAAAEPAGGLPPGTHVLTSPIVGTFYRSPSPDASPFVEVGSRVKKGQVLCIIEAMKLMNEIESDIDGEILQIFPQNAQAVEFGEQLFAIRPL
jgi:acetyl-CoA carboxylase biotin carboxyl carrier protein